MSSFIPKLTALLFHQDNGNHGLYRHDENKEVSSSGGRLRQAEVRRRPAVLLRSPPQSLRAAYVRHCAQNRKRNDQFVIFFAMSRNFDQVEFVRGCLICLTSPALTTCLCRFQLCAAPLRRTTLRSGRYRSVFFLCTHNQGHAEVRWRPGQETSLAPPCSSLRPFGSKCTVLKKVLAILLGLLGARVLCPPQYALAHSRTICKK